MSANTISKLLQRLTISYRGIAPASYSTVSTFQKSMNNAGNFAMFPTSKVEKYINSSLPRFEINVPRPRNGIIPVSIENPTPVSSIIMDLPKNQTPTLDKESTNSLECPTGPTIEKQAARLIVIRRRKMRKHKLRKLRKRMKFVFRKRRMRREQRKEKAFQAELLAQIKVAEDFDAKSYVDSRLQILDHKRIPSKWRGEVLPEAMIRQFMKEKEERWLKRVNRPRITLD